MSVDIKKMITDIYKVYIDLSEAQFEVEICASLLSLKFNQMICIENLIETIRNLEIDMIKIYTKSTEFRLHTIDIEDYSIVQATSDNTDNSKILTIKSLPDRILRILLVGN